MHFMDEGIGPLLSQWFSGKRILDLGAGCGSDPREHRRQRGARGRRRNSCTARGLPRRLPSAEPAPCASVPGGGPRCRSGQYGTKFELDGANVSYHAVDGAINVVEFTQGRVKWADLAAPVVIPGAPFDWARACCAPAGPPSSRRPVLGKRGSSARDLAAGPPAALSAERKPGRS